MAEPPSSSSIEPFKGKPPETISPPPEGDDGAGAGKTLPDEPAAASKNAADPAQSATFANTKQHVADRQKALAATERFTNTKQNIALISDPKNGPRFTLTKRESGHVETSGTKPASLAADETVSDQEAKGEGGAEAEAKADATESVPVSEAKPAAGSVTADETKESTEQQAADSMAKRVADAPGVPPAAKPPDKVPIDSSKTFVGPNGTYYDEAWRWMDWRGVKRSWNWSAALSFGHWFAYRRLYRCAAVVVVLLILLVAALVNNMHVGLVVGLLILSMVLMGLYGNTLYFQVFRSAVADVTEKGEGSYDDLRQQLADAGGVNPLAPWMMAAMTVTGIGFALGLTFFVRDTLMINIWPF